MTAITKVLLSGSTSGQPITVAATSSPGTTIHTAQSGSTGFDEIWLYVSNPSGSSVVVTVQFGGTGSVQNAITQTVPASSGAFLIVPGLILNGGLSVLAYAATGSVVNISGFVNRMT